MLGVAVNEAQKTQDIGRTSRCGQSRNVTVTHYSLHETFELGKLRDNVCEATILVVMELDRRLLGSSAHSGPVNKDGMVCGDSETEQGLEK